MRKALLGSLALSLALPVAGRCATSAAAPSTALGKLVATLKPGEIKAFQSEAYTRDLLKSWYDWDHDAKGNRVYGAQAMFNIMGSWANDGKWDPKTGQVLYLGIGHYAALKFVTYSAERNAWTQEAVPWPLDPRHKDSVCRMGKNGNKWWPRSHTYDSQFIDPERRRFGIIWRPNVYTYDIDRKQWSYHKLKRATAKNASMPAECFPEMKGVLYLAGGRTLTLCDPETGKERALANVPAGIHGVMEYNPVYKAMLVGGGDSRDGGNRNMSLVNAEGKITSLQSLPVRINCTPRSKLMCDPVSGEYIVQEITGRRSKKKPKVYALHPVLNEWKEIPDLRFPAGVAVPLSTYGVVMICGKREIHVYKHKPVWPGELKKQQSKEAGL
jgi:hypothetical protein